MTLLPVIERELRAESRHLLTYWLRVVGVASLLIVAVAFWLNHGFMDRQGGQLFGALHQALFWGIWLLVPLLTADCISRERREGTLGLLFLTPLRAHEIVMAKGLAHGLRGLMVFLAALPVVVIPFLMGGVDWRIATVSALLNVTSFIWALSAGVLASSRNRTLTSSLCWAALWAFLLFWVMVLMGGFLFVTFVFSARGFSAQLAPAVSYLAAGLAAVLSFFNMWQWSMARVPPPGQPVWLEAYGWLLVVSVLAVIGLWVFAAWNIRQTWPDKPPSVRRQRIEQQLFTPAFGVRLFRAWMRRTLERNPVGWLERRTWQARLVSWSWLAVMIGIYSWALGETGSGFSLWMLNELIACLLLGSVALSAAGSFRRERELGMMELLLIAPLRVGQIVAGRVRGLWGQFLPAVALFLMVWWFFSAAFGPGQRWASEGFSGWVRLFQMAVTFSTLPVLGLYFSLHCRHYLVAALMTLMTGLALPYGLSLLFRMTVDRSGSGLFPVSCGALVWLVAAMVLLGIGRQADYRGLLGRGVGFVLLPIMFAIVSGSRLAGEEAWPGSVLLHFLQLFSSTLMPASLQILLAAGCGALLHRSLTHRIFAFPG